MRVDLLTKADYGDKKTIRLTDHPPPQSFSHILRSVLLSTLLFLCGSFGSRPVVPGEKSCSPYHQNT